VRLHARLLAGLGIPLSRGPRPSFDCSSSSFLHRRPPQEFRSLCKLSPFTAPSPPCSVFWTSYSPHPALYRAATIDSAKFMNDVTVGPDENPFSHRIYFIARSFLRFSAACTCLTDATQYASDLCCIVLDSRTASRTVDAPSPFIFSFRFNEAIDKNNSRHAPTGNAPSNQTPFSCHHFNSHAPTYVHHLCTVTVATFAEPGKQPWVAHE
jgi:hypothetical protein